MVYSEEPTPAILDREAEAEAEARPLGGAGGAGGARRARGADALWRVAAAEACGTALLVALTCLPGCAAAPPAPLERALGAGLAVAALVQCFDHVSGAHFNPTVTLCALLARRVSGAHAAAALAAQAAGALAGAAALRALSPGAVALCVTRPDPRVVSACQVSARAEAARAAGAAALRALSPGAVALCVTRPDPRVVSACQALCVEALLGAVLALANLAAWDARNAAHADSWPLRIGFVVAALTLAAGDVTGASANPARSAAPAALSGDTRALWVYVAGGPCGACLAAALYALAWRRAPAPPRAAPAPV